MVEQVLGFRSWVLGLGFSGFGSRFSVFGTGKRKAEIETPTSNDQRPTTRTDYRPLATDYAYRSLNPQPSTLNPEVTP